MARTRVRLAHGRARGARLEQVLASAATPEQLAAAAGTLAALRAGLERDHLGPPTG